jgi:von Willebrand factor type A domain
MTVSHPWALPLAALAAPVVLAYLHRLHRLKRPIASTILVRVIRDARPAAHRARSKLRHRLSLALMLIALLAALFALAGPHASTQQGARVVIVLDRSASMATRDGGTDRLAQAADAAKHVVERAGDDDEVALVTAGGAPAIEVAPTRHHADVLSAIEAVVRRGATGDNRDDAIAFSLADGLCRDRERTTIVIASDGGVTVPPTKCQIQALPVGRAASNAGITGFAVHSVDGLGTYDVHLAVAATSTRKLDVTLTADGAIVDVIALDIPPSGQAERTVRESVDRGHLLVATIAPGDALALDDRAEAPLASDGPVSVLLVTAKPNSLTAEALRVHPRVALDIAAPGKLPATAHDLIVVEDPPGAPLPPATHIVALGVSPGAGAPVALGDAATAKGIVRWDFDAPYFRYVDLRDLIIQNAHVVTGGRAIADSASGPMIAMAPWGRAELMVTGFTVDETDLTLRAAFPNLMANFVDWSAPDSKTEPARGVLSAAETINAPRALPGSAVAMPSRWTDAPWLARLAVIIALALLVLEQALAVRTGRTSS